MVLNDQSQLRNESHPLHAFYSQQIQDYVEHYVEKDKFREQS